MKLSSFSPSKNQNSFCKHELCIYLYELLHIFLRKSPVHVKMIPGVQNDSFDLDTHVNAGATTFLADWLIKLTLLESQSLTMNAMSVSDRVCPLLKHVRAISRMMFLITPSAWVLDIFTQRQHLTLTLQSFVLRLSRLTVVLCGGCHGDGQRPDAKHKQTNKHTSHSNTTRDYSVLQHYQVLNRNIIR